MQEMLIRNHCAHERVDPRFLPLVEAARSGMVACCGSRLRELRLQGSIARGDARVGHADLDMIALLDGSPTDSEARCLAELSAALAEGTSVVTRFDLEAVDAGALEPFRRFVLSSDSICIHGADTLTIPVQSMRRFDLARMATPDAETILPDDLAWAAELESADDSERLFASRIIGKDLLKVLRGVLLLRGASYEVTIAGIAAQAPQVAPEAAPVAWRLHALYAEPTTDVSAIRETAAAAAALLAAFPELALLRRNGDHLLQSEDAAS